MNGNVEKVYKLTPMQEGILFQSIKKKDSYLDQYSCRLKGTVDSDKLLEAWKIVIGEYEIFRTAFVWERVSEPLQVVVKNVKSQIKYLDYSNLCEEDYIKKIYEYRSKDITEGFDLTKPGLLRVSLIKKNDNEYEYIWTIHHLIIDGVSVPILMKRVYEIYSCLLSNKEISENKTMQFGEYVAWLKKQNVEDAINYWKDYLEKLKYPTLIAKDSKYDKYNNCRLQYTIPENVADKIRNVARANNISDFHIYNLAYAILLQRYTNQRAVVYGKLVSGRSSNIKGISKAIGVFINNIPNFIFFSDNCSVRYLIENEVEHHVKASAYEYVSQLKVRELVGINQDLYDSLFLYENYSLEDIYDEKIGFTICDEHIDESTNYNLNWIVRPAKKMELNIVFNTIVIRKEQINSMEKAYIKILEQIAENFDIKVSDIVLENAMTGITDIYNNMVPTWFKGYITDENGKVSKEVGYIDDDGNIHNDYSMGELIPFGDVSIKRKDIVKLLIDEKVVSNCAIACEDATEGKVYICCLSADCKADSAISRHIIKHISQKWELSKKLLKERIDIVECDELPGCGEINDEARAILTIVQNEIRKKAISVQIVNFPETDSEKILEDIWKDILGFEKVDTKVSFFEIGGNSIEIIKMISRIREIFNKDISINEIIEMQTIHRLAEYIDSMDTEINIDEKVPHLTDEQKQNGVEVSYEQRRFWFMNQYNPHDAFSNLSESVKLVGRINVDCLKEAIHELILRQESLRTTFYMDKGSVFQKINEDVEPDFEVIDIKEFENDREKLNDYISVIVQKPFSLSEGPLFRCKLLRINDLEMILVISIHHIISDGWSLQIFFDELMKLYQAITDKEDIKRIEAPAIQYIEYAAWKRKEEISQNYIDEESEFWKGYLSGVEELAFPNDFKRPAEQTFKGKRAFYELSGELKKSVDRLAAIYETTSFNVYFTAYILLLHRYTQQYDITVGIPYGVRELQGTENTIGCFLNSVAVRSILCKDMTFSQAFDVISGEMHKVFEHAKFPFDLVVDSVCSKRDMSKNPIFQLMFLFQNVPPVKETLNDIAYERMEINNNVSTMDFSLYVKERSDRVELVAEYSNILFREQTIARFLRHFENTLKQFIAEQEQSIETFDYMIEEEKKEILYTFNDTAKDYGTNKFIHQLFEEQAELHPNNEALIFESVHLTYDELNRKANKLAHFLINQGAKKNQIIGVYMKRSVDMVVALYGILKSGAAYLPLDPSYPEERVKYMIEDSEVQTIIINEPAGNILSEYKGRIVDIGDESVTEDCLDTNPEVEINENDYAYMIYTSGSTGKPKGVINIHKGIGNRILWIRTYFKNEPNSRQMQKTPFSFDVSLGEFFGSLTNGACLVVAKPDGHKDVEYMIDLILKEKITHVHFVPSLLKQFMSSERVELCADTIKQICCTGEALPYDLVEDVKKKLPMVDIYNLYGPTEAAVEVTSWNCKDKLDVPLISIGKPMCNTQIYILDPYMQMVPIGVIGEIYIAGRNLAAGYFHREELTSERFIDNPFSKGEKMYRTGDYARYLPDGNIDYIGRVDNQVKIRGNRIEIGEIETNLSKLDGVKDCAVIVSKEESPRIVAYVVPISEKENFNNSLVPRFRDELRKKLPDYMIPSIFMYVDHFELHPNGKLNFSKLPDPSEFEETTSSDYVAPENDIQRGVADIWCEILGTKKISINDNFFEIGGHSILAMELLRKINQKFSVNLSIVDIFMYPTIKSISLMLKEGKKKQDSEEKKSQNKKLMEARKKQNERMKKIRLEKEHSNG